MGIYEGKNQREIDFPEPQVVEVEPEIETDSIAPPPIDFEKFAEKERQDLKELWGPDAGEA